MRSYREGSEFSPLCFPEKLTLDNCTYVTPLSMPGADMQTMRFGINAEGLPYTHLDQKSFVAISQHPLNGTKTKLLVLGQGVYDEYSHPLPFAMGSHNVLYLDPKQSGMHLRFYISREYSGGSEEQFLNPPPALLPENEISLKRYVRNEAYFMALSQYNLQPLVVERKQGRYCEQPRSSREAENTVVSIPQSAHVKKILETVGMDSERTIEVGTRSMYSSNEGNMAVYHERLLTGKNPVGEISFFELDIIEPYRPLQADSLSTGSEQWFLEGIFFILVL